MECKKCPYRDALEEERKKLLELQKAYLDKIKDVNKTLAKYTRKLESEQQCQ